MGSHDESKPDDTRTDLGSVSNDNKEEIDIELAKSIEKLVEEETNVAKENRKYLSVLQPREMQGKKMLPR